jgi:hypothetical protein
MIVDGIEANRLSLVRLAVEQLRILNDLWSLLALQGGKIVAIMHLPHPSVLLATALLRRISYARNMTFGRIPRVLLIERHARAIFAVLDCKILGAFDVAAIIEAHTRGHFRNWILVAHAVRLSEVHTTNIPKVGRVALIVNNRFWRVCGRNAQEGAPELRLLLTGTAELLSALHLHGSERLGRREQCNATQEKPASSGNAKHLSSKKTLEADYQSREFGQA